LPREQQLDPADFAGSLAVWLETVGKIEPRPLADLFRMANAEDDDLSIALRNVLQTFLLRRTLDHARSATRYYAADSRYACWRPDCHDAPPRMEGLPVIGREEVAAGASEFLADDVTVRSICHTSGTTDLPLDIYKSFEEVDFVQAFFSHLFAPIRKSLPSLPLVLTFPNFHHGVPVPMPGIGMTFVGGVTDDTLIRDARRQIDATYRIPGHDERISIISGLHHYLLLFTSYLLEQGVDPAQYRMNAINITGGFVPAHWRRFLEESWKCQVNDRFTLTEVIGGASRIAGTEFFSLDSHIVGESLDLDSGRAVDEGVGMLTLTNLYPFVQMQPLVRYKTGDLVRRVRHEVGFRFQFLGKMRNCISRERHGRREWMLFSSRLVDILAELPDLEVYDWFSNVRSVRDRTLGSFPVMSVDSRQSGKRFDISVTIELRYAPHCRAARVAELRRAIVSGLRDTPDTELARGIDSGDVALDVAFVGPGTLKPPPLIKV
jgi:phenylacetate-coenzyme A ligase PaaK-like adenylate-forming protein